MKQALGLEQLKELLKTHTKKEVLDCPSLGCGIPKGAITEISGNGKTEFVTGILAKHPMLKVAWIEEKISVNPFGLQQKKIKPSQVLFVEAGDQTEWAVFQALKAQIFSVVIMYKAAADLKSLRRIQIASEKSQASTLWLTPHPQGAWTSSVQIQISKNRLTKELQAKVLKQRM